VIIMSSLFLSRFLRDPRRVGAIAPSSGALAQVMVAALPREGQANVVELGPGTGAFTGHILERLGRKGRYLGIEVDPAFAAVVRERFPGATCVTASAERLDAIVAEQGLGPVDHVVSGLPWASLPGPAAGRIIERIAAALRPGGTFTTFQYVHAYWMPPAVAFRRAMTARLGAAPTARLVVPNLPPAFVLAWRRAGR
jgi:phosphatidylethanolamine/phosphatidyl-N-methylethanolamine N-methyltransferase